MNKAEIKCQLLLRIFSGPPLGRVGVRLRGGALYWRKCLRAMHAFGTSQNNNTLKLATPIAIRNKENS